jgi:hypothetical protein
LLRYIAAFPLALKVNPTHPPTHLWFCLDGFHPTRLLWFCLDEFHPMHLLSFCLNGFFCPVLRRLD